MTTTPPMVGVPILVWWLVGPSSRICWPKPSLRNWLIATRVPRRETKSANAPLSRIALIRLPSLRVDPDRWAMIPYAAPLSDAARRGPLAYLLTGRVLRRAGQQLAHHVPVVEGVHHPRHLLTGLVSLAGDDHDVAGPGQPQRGLDGRPPVALLDHLGAAPPGAVEHRGPDRRRLLGAGVVVGDDDEVGEPGRDLAHDRPLAGVAVTAGPEDDQQPAAGERPQGLEGGLDGIRLVGVVDDDRERLPGVDALEPARHPPASRDAGGDGRRVEAGLGARRDRGQGVRDVEVARERHAAPTSTPGPCTRNVVPSGPGRTSLTVQSASDPRRRRCGPAAWSRRPASGRARRRRR